MQIDKIYQQIAEGTNRVYLHFASGNSSSSRPIDHILPSNPVKIV